MFGSPTDQLASNFCIRTVIQDWSIQSRGHRCALTGEAFTEGCHFFTALFRTADDGLQRLDFSESSWEKLSRGETETNSESPAEAGMEIPSMDTLFSFWRSKFIAPPPPAPEAVPRESAEAFLRHLLSQARDVDGRPAPEVRRTCYFLALMLERKRILKPIDPKVAAQKEADLAAEETESGAEGNDENPSTHAPTVADQIQNATDAASGADKVLVYEHAKTGEIFVLIDPEMRLDQLEEVQKEVAEMLAQGIGASSEMVRASEV